MVTITCKIPDALNDQLETEASRKLLSKSEIIRNALERSLKNSNHKGEKSAFESVKDLCGIIKDGPADMSTNPKYMDGFGK
jgi:metal-responsive CopG/Arc/MetJ family transcriptional regulator